MEGKGGTFMEENEMGALHKGIYQALWEEGEMGLSR